MAAGAVGLYAAALGARRVTLTDGGSAALLELASSNVDLNRELWVRSGDETVVQVESYKWGEAADDTVYSGYDWILGSDVTYAAHAHRALCLSIAAQMRHHSPGAQVILAHQHRGETAEDERLLGFVAEVESIGLRVKTIRTVSVDRGGRLVSLLCISDSDQLEG